MYKQIDLTDEEQADLVVKAQTGNQKASERLIMGNINLIRSIINYKFNMVGSPLYEDMLQTGVEGLLKAIKLYKPEAKVKYSTFAHLLVFQELYKFVIKNGSSVRITETAYSNTVKDVDKFHQQHLTNDVEEEALDYTSLPNLEDPTDIVQLWLMGYRLSPNKLVSEVSVFDEVAQSEYTIKLKEAVESLSFEDQDIISKIYGVFNSETMSIKHLASSLNLTESQVVKRSYKIRQSLKKILEEMEADDLFNQDYFS